MPTREIATGDRVRVIPGRPVVPPQRAVPGQVIGPQDGPLPMSVRLSARAGELRRSWARTLHDLRHRPPRYRSPRKLLVLVPAHNEAETIGHTLHALLAQTRPA